MPRKEVQATQEKHLRRQSAQELIPSLCSPCPERQRAEYRASNYEHVSKGDVGESARLRT